MLEETVVVFLREFGCFVGVGQEVLLVSGEFHAFEGVHDLVKELVEGYLRGFVSAEHARQVEVVGSIVLGNASDDAA